MARRYDYFRLDASNLRRTPQGGVVAPAALTRTGIFVYKRGDGSTVRELRPPEEVFHADSLASLAHAPLTIGHVAQINPENWGAHTVGHIAGEAKQDGHLVTAECRIQRADALKKVEAGTLKELSCGYDVEIDPTAGEWQGQRYDCIQRRPRYNHVALLPEGSGRAGPEVSLRTDSAFAVIEGDEVHADEPPKPASQENADAARDYPRAMPTELETKLQTENEALKTRLDALEKSQADEKVKGRIAAVEAERDTLKKRIDGLPAEIEAAATERANLLSLVTPHMPKGWRPDGKGEVAVKKEVLGVLRKDMKLDGRSEDFVRGAFEEVIARADVGREGLARIQPATLRAVEDARSGDDEEGVSASEQRMKDRNKDAWKMPIKGAMTRDGMRR